MVRRTSRSWCRPSGARNPARVGALAGRVSAGGAGGAEGSFVGWQGLVCRLLPCVHVRGCGRAQFCLEPCSGCRCKPISQVAVPCGGGVAQLWHWGSSVQCAACQIAGNGSAHARQTFGIWSSCLRAVSVTRRSRSQVESLCMFLYCFDLSKPSTFTCIIPIGALRRLKMYFLPPTRATAHAHAPPHAAARHAP